MRGEIENRARARQIINFKGLQYGKITPTDCDGIIEYKNKGFILIEAKCGDKDLPYGQKLAYERMIDALDETRPAVLFIGRHNTPVHEDIDAAALIVRDYYWQRQWLTIDDHTMKYMIDSFIGFLNKE